MQLKPNMARLQVRALPAPSHRLAPYLQGADGGIGHLARSLLVTEPR